MAFVFVSKQEVKGILILILLGICTAMSLAHPWQQRVDYRIEVSLDAQNNMLDGKLKLNYVNNSPDSLDMVYFHLYYNAFQPGSMMDVRSRSIADPDKRVKDRIFNLQEQEIGYQKVQNLTCNGQKVAFVVKGTVLKGMLNAPILPGESVVFDIDFVAQIPKQIRRTGRDNKEGVRYSMAQWYPKIAEYDRQGWHPHQYVGREYYSPWGNYDVKIRIDSSYTVAAGGVLQNPDQIGKGYSDTKPTMRESTYHFVANNVHDFVWAADTAYAHDIVKMRDGLVFHYFYKSDTLSQQWKKLQLLMKTALPYIESKFGEYPYPVYNVIQGGDGGMEYPMATLITGQRKLMSLLEVTLHELMHSWYQMMLATNESYLYWMDEGFTTFAENEVKAYVLRDTTSNSPHLKEYEGYRKLARSGIEEPLTTHADFFNTNQAYSYGAYHKGCVALNQLRYILGDDTFDRAMLRYYREWRFRHPDEIDFIRVLEKESGMELNWYLDFWVKTTKQIDYKLETVYDKDKGTHIRVEKVGQIPMPLDVHILLTSGQIVRYHIPTDLTLGHKDLSSAEKLLSDWPWVNAYYSFDVPYRLKDIKEIVIDPNMQMADLTPDDNKYPLRSSLLQIHGHVEIPNME